MKEYILETRKLTKQFGRQKAVEDVEIRIPTGSVYGLLGPNGAGKSTTLKMITGMLIPTSGQILYRGHEYSRKDLRKMGSLIEGPAIYENLSAKENLQVRNYVLQLPKSRMDEVLEIVGLSQVGKKRAGNFSLGMKQRLGIAIALLNEPEFLILDEPTNGLDPAGIQELRRLISDLSSQGMTIVVSSHILSEIELVADEIGIISSGSLQYQDTYHKGMDLEQLFMDITTKYQKGVF